MDKIGPILNGAGVFILACVSVYNLIVARNRAEIVANLEKNTNSIKDALIRVTGESEHAKGILIGKAEATASGLHERK